jgi:8-amino-3,8-dideoxy-alpha-D-manno-octulosonate transaminase
MKMPGFEVFGDEERKEVQDVLETGVLFRYGFDQARKGHWKARTFEVEFSKRLGVSHCLLVSSGTAAVSTALAATGVGAGDEVIIPPFTFVASFESVLAAGAVPVFADIDETLCLAPDAIEDKITSRTKAVMPVHMCGSMARIDEIKALCDRKGLFLIEDACQSAGATYHGKSVGTFGRMGCFSFDPVKTITCGEGGAVVTDDSSLYSTASAFSDHGHDHIGTDRGLEKHPIMGTNFRISELNAAVGVAQLRKLDTLLEKQRRHKEAIREALEAFPKLSFAEVPDPAGDSATFLSFFAPDASAAKALAKKLSGAGIDGCFYWYENNWHYINQWDHFKELRSAARLPIQGYDNVPDYRNLNLEKSDRILNRTICLSIRVSWTPEALKQRIDKMVEVVRNTL